MALQFDLLENARTTGGGRIQARCPACAEGGGDTKAEHLVVYPDGRFGCCLHPGDKQHRKRIFALVGRKKTIPVITVRPAPRTVRQSIRVEMTPMKLPAPLTKPDPDSEKPILSVPEMKSGLGLPPVGTPGTLGTPCLNTRGYSRKKSITYAPSIYGGTDLPVPSVPSVPNQSPKPYIDADGNLRIPFDSPERYHWWKGGRSITETLSEIQSAGASSTTLAPQDPVPDHLRA
jgi:hypothetical protein